MPYIEQQQREKLDLPLRLLIRVLRDAPDGAVNYVITRLVDAHYKGKGYVGYNAALGVLEAVKQEYYRRIIAPYENVKRNENGEVYC